MFSSKAVACTGVALLALAALPLVSNAQTVVGDPDIQTDVAENHFTTPNDFELTGQGLSNLTSTNCKSAGLICPDNSCQCIESFGQSRGTFVGIGEFDLLLQIDFGTPIADGGQDCFAASGVDFVTAHNENQLVLQTTGLACNSPDGALGIYTGTFGITAGVGTGEFADSIGAGTFNWSDFIATGRTQVHAVGSVNLNP